MIDSLAETQKLTVREKRREGGRRVRKEGEEPRKAFNIW